jgi:MFS family permease
MGLAAGRTDHRYVHVNSRSSIVNVAVSTIQKEFDTTPQDIQWIVTAYTLCMGVVVPASAWLGDRIGLKRLYLISPITFSVASMLCGGAWNLNSMIIFRVLQAAPGGIIPVICTTLVYRIVPQTKVSIATVFTGWASSSRRRSARF